MTALSGPQKRGWLAPALLIALSLVPILAGGVRLAQLSGGTPVKPEDGRFFASPAPVVLHIIAVTLYAVLGALQFAPALRQKGAQWHRRAGWLVLPCGLVAALTGLWMTLFYPPIATDSAALRLIRLVVGGAMIAFLILAVVAVRRRQFKTHGEHMIRAYALGMGAGTQVLTHLPWFLLIGQPGPTSRAFLMGAAWLINIAVAEWIIHRKPGRANMRGLHPLSSS